MGSNSQDAAWSVASRWRKYDAMESRLTAPVSERMLDLAGLQPGTRLLDVGCGSGEPSLRAAARLGPSASILGIDASESMLELARENAALAGVAERIYFRKLEAESLDVPAGSFDVVTARWSLMYLRDADEALRRIQRALAPGARFVAAFWAEPARVDFASVPRSVLARFTALPAETADAPGVFRFADEQRIRESFERAGLGIERIEELSVPVAEFESGGALVEWFLDFGGALSRLARALPEETQAAWRGALTVEAERLRKGKLIRLGGTTRVVVARPRGAGATV